MKQYSTKTALKSITAIQSTKKSEAKLVQRPL